MYFLLWCSYAIISLALGDTCSGPSNTPSANQYQCWHAPGELQTSSCIPKSEKCDNRDRCNCEWCDDQWNCPTFEACQANGGFVCPHTYLPESNQVWVCIPQDWLCDGIWDCPSGEDESREYCDVSKCEGNRNLTYWYQCTDTGRCIDVWLVGDGAVDCVNGEDEENEVIAAVANFFTTTSEPTTMPSPAPTSRPTTSPPTTSQPTSPPTTSPPTARFEDLFGINLVVDVLGVTYEQVCRGTEARFPSLERVLASILQLSPIQVSTSCQNETDASSSDSSDSSESSDRRILRHYSSSSSSSSDSQSEEQEQQPSFQKVIANLRFDNKVKYLQVLRHILKYVRNVYDMSSSSDEDFSISVEEFGQELGRRLSDVLQKLVRVEVIEVSGSA